MVVLPAPLGPRRPTISPSFTEKEISLTAVKSPNFLVRWVKSEKLQRGLFQINNLFPLIDKKALGVIVGLIGLMLITITGALGGSIVYGTDTDPAVRFIYKILRLFINI